MDQFDNWLSSRKIPPPRSNLESRILAAAVPFEKTSIWKQIKREFENVFVLPRPAYAMAVLVILSVVAGFQIDLLGTDAQLSGFDALATEISADQYLISGEL